jgi:hypothetical protein
MVQSAPFTHPRAACNGIFMIFTEPIPQQYLQSCPFIAREIRASINNARDPEFIEKWMSFAASFMIQSANAGETGRFQWFFAQEGEWTINSNYRSVINICPFMHYRLPILGSTGTMPILVSVRMPSSTLLDHGTGTVGFLWRTRGLVLEPQRLM